MLERRVISIQGMVQGVGFRPFVFRLASALELRGLVRNDSAGVVVDVEGELNAIETLLAHLSQGPPSAAIDSISAEPAVLRSWPDFHIAASEPTADRQALVSPDVATCDACVKEMFDPADRRYRYPFVTCTLCGPRFTIIREVPYDRPNTSMAAFPMCIACRREYEDPSNRRFHAQPIACWECGPRLRLEPASGGGSGVAGDPAIQAAAQALRQGEILAIKGLGGFHLACDASNSAAVRRLRERKHREAKPLALMVANAELAERLCHVSELEAKLLHGAARPIVLLARRAGAPVSDEAAPGSLHLGIMLPYTPVHHLLLAAVEFPLVMTSGNRSDEPIAYLDLDVTARLAGIADRFLTHNRPIATRCDDSVTRVVHGATRFVRRSRGFAPRPIRLAVPFPIPVLGVGGHLKNTFCLGRGRHAFVSQHIGDLETLEAYRALEEGIAHYRRLFKVQPEIVAHDLHPDYLSTRLAEEQLGVERLAVQHHHAHVASCVAEHGVTEPVLGIVFDGAGLGADGAIWGGEFLLVEGAGYQRIAHLGYVALPGGDAVARQPWRAAASHLWAAYHGEVGRVAAPFFDSLDQGQWALVRQLLERGVQALPTSSVGRLFDAVAALVGLRMDAQFEGQAATMLEMAADPTALGGYPVELREAGEGWIVDPGALVRGVVNDLAAGRPVAEIAGKFHNALRDVITEVATRVRARSGIHRVALTGGVFQNALLTERAAVALTRRDFEVLLQERVPCNDGGLSLGQAYVAGRTAARKKICA